LADSRAERKAPRIHPKEAHHQIEDLPPLSQEFKRVERLDGQELAESLGLEVRGAGEETEVWYVGSRGQESG